MDFTGQDEIYSNIDEEVTKATVPTDEGVCLTQNVESDSTLSDCQLEGMFNSEETVNKIVTFDIQFFHSYAKVQDFGQMFHCSNCNFETSKKDNLRKHEEAYCIIVPVKDMECIICGKKFTYDKLRGHLRYFVKSQYGATGEHAKYTPEEHNALLQKLKEKRKEQ